MLHKKLSEYYKDKGLKQDQFWIGGEHPALENYAIKLIDDLERKHILEIGFQAGGFSVPIITKFKKIPNFYYVGVDNLDYHNSVNPQLIKQFLDQEGVAQMKYDFFIEDANNFIKNLFVKFDLILMDHFKANYPKDLKLIFEKKLLAEGGIILVHDVLAKAKEVWRECIFLCEEFKYDFEVNEKIPAGLGYIVKGE